LRSENQELLEALSRNSSLERDIAIELLEKKSTLAQNIAQTIQLDAELFEALLPHAAALAFNESLDEAMQAKIDAT